MHDIGKLRELEYHPVEAKYTKEGCLIGHVLMGRDMVREAAQKIDGFPQELLLLLEHAILAHHGKREFGAPVPPLTLEALIVSYIDELDAKVNMVARQSIDSQADEPFTERIYRARESPVLQRGAGGGCRGRQGRASAGVIGGCSVWTGLSFGLHRRLGGARRAGVELGSTSRRNVDLAGVFSGATRPGTGAPLPGSAVGSVVDTTTTVSSTTTTTAPTTTVPATTTTSTATVASPVSTAAGGVVSAIETGEMDGAVTTDAGQQLIGQLQPMLFSVQPAPQEMDQFDQLVQTINLDVDNGEISGTATIGSLNSALGDLAAALGVTTSAPVTSLPGPSGGPGHGHGHGQGN